MEGGVPKKNHSAKLFRLPARETDSLQVSHTPHMISTELATDPCRHSTAITDTLGEMRFSRTRTPFAPTNSEQKKKKKNSTVYRSPLDKSHEKMNGVMSIIRTKIIEKT
jgi:hypothetical protein